METTIVPPNPHHLLQPLLACLPTAPYSPRPPPALLALLSPILRRRVLLNTPSAAPTAAATAAAGSWLPLLNWTKARADRLPALVADMPLEPHPVSGEVELCEPVRVSFRRADEETLVARLRVGELGVVVSYLWCEAGSGPDAEDAQAGWKVAELGAADDDDEEDEGWCEGLEQAEAEFAARRGWGGAAASASTASGNSGGVPLSNGAGRAPNGAPSMSVTAAEGDDQDDDDGSYWAAYDQTPGPTAPGSTAPGGRTPAKHSPARGVSSVGSDDYFDRYMTEVQPAADPYDPSEAAAAAAAAAVSPVLVDHEEGSSTWSSQHVVSLPSPSARVVSVPDTPRHGDDDDDDNNNNDAHRQRRSRSGSGDGEQAEVGVRQHISTDIKSLYRLARATGISRAEFERIVRTELDVLGMMELDMDGDRMEG